MGKALSAVVKSLMKKQPLNTAPREKLFVPGYQK